MSQVNLHDDTPVDEADEELVAYLDGELLPEEVRTIEQRLANDSTLRNRLRELQNGWEMLDELPLASSSNTLLETTLRMAAIDGDKSLHAATNPSAWQRYSPLIWLVMATAACFVLGIAAVQARDYWHYHKQLRDLPNALHLDVYLHASDLELMMLLEEMPEWQQATQIADRLGVWNFDLVNQVQSARTKKRESLLPSLPIEAQETIRQAWERYENISDERKAAILQSAEVVAKHEDSQALLNTMDRFAAWQQTLPVEKRDQLTTGSIEERKEFIRTTLEETTRQWTRDRGRALTSDEVEVVYLAVREIARLRVDQLRNTATPEVKVTLDAVGFGRTAMEPQIEASFLRRMFDPKYSGPGRREGDSSPPPFVPQMGSSSTSIFSVLRTAAEGIRAPLRDDELYMLHSVLPDNLSDFINAAVGIPNLQEELLRSWAEESLRRTQWNRTGQTALERYQSRAPEEREAIDLMPTDRLLRSLQSENRR